jgi:hypothetical protein
VAVEQVRALVAGLPRRPAPLFVSDAGHDVAAFAQALAATPAALLIRLRGNRSCFATLQRELVDRPDRPAWPTRAAARRALFEDVEVLS